MTKQDLIGRLRQRAEHTKLLSGECSQWADLVEAAEEIERLRAAGKPQGCVCPGTLAAGCHAPMCPRRPLPSPKLEQERA